MSITNLNLTLHDDDEFDSEDLFSATETTEILTTSTVSSSSIEEESWMAMRQYYSKVLMGLARDPQTAAGLMGLNTTAFGAFLSPHDSALANLSEQLTRLVKRRRDPGRTVIIILVYAIIIAVSLFGNLLVCHVVLRTRRLHTLTNTFLANLAVSDLLMTALNIPFNVARVLLDDWPFGGFMCSVVPFVQVTSVNVSAFTMVAIALDRYQVIVHPLKPRLGAFHGAIIITVVWFLAAFVSLPYAIFSEVVEVFTYRRLIRCQARYPPPAMQFRQWLTLATFLIQYVIPLTITAVAYIGVTRRVWWRAVVGAATQEQLSLQLRAKKKTVKMLLIVVVLFALCWLPLNTYHLVVDFGASVGPSRHSSSIFFICHWFAMSNVCYNPFIYCWLNDHFRAGAKAWLRCAARKICRIPFPEDNEEPPGARVSRPRDSITLSSSALVGGSSVRRKIGRGSVRSNHASDFHVTLDELMITPTSSRGNQQRYNSNSVKRNSKRMRNLNRGDSPGNSPQREDDKAVQTDDICTSHGITYTSSIVSCTHGECSTQTPDLPRVEVDPPCIINIQNLQSRSPSSAHILTVEEMDVSDNFQLAVREKQSKDEAMKYDRNDKDTMRSAPLESESGLGALHQQKEVDTVHPDFERISQNPRLHPIPEESPKSVPQLLYRYLDCQQPIKESISLPSTSQPPEVYDTFPPTDEALHIEKKSFTDGKNKVEDEVLKVSVTSKDGIIHHKKVTRSPGDIIRAIRDHFAASLSKRLSALNSKASTAKSTSKSSHEGTERPSSPSLCWSEEESSSSLIAHKHILTGTTSPKADAVDVLKKSQNIQSLPQKHGEYIDVILPNEVMECINVSELSASSDIDVQNKNIYPKIIRVGSDTNGHRLDHSSKENRGQVTTPILNPIGSNVMSSTRGPKLSDISTASENNGHSYGWPMNVQPCYQKQVDSSSSESQSPLYCNTKADAMQSPPGDGALNGSPVFHQPPNLNQYQSPTQATLQPTLRTSSTPNLNLCRSGPIVPQQSLQSSRSVTSWSLFTSASPSRRLLPSSTSPIQQTLDRNQPHEGRTRASWEEV